MKRLNGSSPDITGKRLWLEWVDLYRQVPREGGLDGILLPPATEPKTLVALGKKKRQDLVLSATKQLPPLCARMHISVFNGCQGSNLGPCAQTAGTLLT